MDVVTDHFVLNSFAPPCRVVIFLFITKILKIELKQKTYDLFSLCHPHGIRKFPV